MYTVSITSLSRAYTTTQWFSGLLLCARQENGNTSVSRCIRWSCLPALGRSHPDPVNGMGILAPVLIIGHNRLGQAACVTSSAGNPTTSPRMSADAG